MSANRQRSTARLLAWAGLVPLAAVQFAAGALVRDQVAASALSWSVSILAIVLACAGALLACRRVTGEERRFWFLLALATGLLVFSESYWAYTVVLVDPTGPVLPHPFEFLQGAAALAFVALVISLTRFGSEPLVVRVRFYADVALGMVAGFVAAYRWLVGPLFEGVPRHSTGLLLVGSLYPVLGATLLAGTFGVLVGFKAERWQPWERLFALSLSVYTAGILVWPWWYRGLLLAEQPQPAGSLVDYLFTGGFYVFFIAAVYRLTETDARSRPRTVPAPVGRWPWFGPAYIGAMTLLVPLLAWASVTADSPGDAQVYLGAAVVLVTLLGTRSWLVTLEGSYLAASSLTDPVTGLQNRRAFEIAMPRYIAERGTSHVSVVAFDIDGFGRLNEIAGRLEADRVLRATAATIAETLGQGDTLFRLGGDDLVAVLAGASPSRAAEIARECGNRVERTVRYGVMAVSLSAGVAAAPEHAGEAEQLVRKAMTAQEWARAAGGARVRVYDELDGHLLDPDERLRRIRAGEHLATVRALSSAADARDPHSAEHSRVVARGAVALAREVGLSDDRVGLIETAALLHDVGKLAVDGRILSKPHLLTEAERVRVREHPAFGERMLRSAGVPEILPWIRHHHERWDGGGYPDRLAGERIPLEARIICIADAYELMVTGRPYQSPLTHRAALRHIELESGTHFDATLAAAFVRIMWDSEPLAEPRTGTVVAEPNESSE